MGVDWPRQYWLRRFTAAAIGVCYRVEVRDSSRELGHDINHFGVRQVDLQTKQHMYRLNEPLSVN